jgi:DNA gyrase subunit B
MCGNHGPWRGLIPSWWVDYDAAGESIIPMETREAVRLRPAMYLGSTNELGLHHMVNEVIYEALAGKCDRIDLTVNFDNSITAVDNGDGIPVGMNRKQERSGAEVILTTLDCGRKLDPQVYNIPGRFRRGGLAIINFLSEWLELEVWHEGNTYRQAYACGVPQEPLRQTGKTGKRGTRISFKPDPQIFEILEFSLDRLSHQMREKPILNSGIRITLTQRTEKNREFFFQVNTRPDEQSSKAQSV